MQRGMSIGTAQLGLGMGANSMSPGASGQSSLAAERQRALLLKTQVQEMRHQRVANSNKIAPVPPVGRNSAAIKAKVFDLPF